MLTKQSRYSVLHITAVPCDMASVNCHLLINGQHAVSQPWRTQQSSQVAHEDFFLERDRLREGEGLGKG